MLPTWNAAGTLPRAVESIRNQSFADWELILVDDGSTDETASLIEGWVRDEPRLQVVRQPHGGVASALNLGLDRARGEFVARMDADDLSRPLRFERQVRFLEAHAEIGVVSCLVEFGGDPISGEGYAAHVAWLNALTTPESLALNRFVEAPVAHPSVMFRRELVARHGGYRDGPFPEDYELWLRWIERGVRLAKVPEPLLVWNDPPTRLSRTDARYDTAAFYALKAPYLARAVRATLAGRALWVWGAGRVTRRRVARLEAEGLDIAGFIDVDRKKWGRPRHGRRVVGPDDLPRPKEAMVLGHVASRGARALIRDALERAGFTEGQDFWMAA